jgi:hypothetical protein
MSNSLNATAVRQGQTFRGLFGEVIPFAATVDVASNIDAAGTTEAITVTGAALGDFVLVAHSLDCQGVTVTAYVSAANTVSIRYQNESAGTVDLASQRVYGVVMKRGQAFDTL